MKIDQIKISNFVGISSVDALTKAPIQVFAGANGAGKSSIQNAIRLAMTGQLCRDVSKKKDYPFLVKNGAKKANVTIEINECGDTFSADLPKMEKASIESECDLLPVILEPHSFAAMKPGERRSFLMKLLNVKPSKDVIIKKCEQRSIDADALHPILPMLRSGFPAACESAKNYARDLKAYWKATTGETWGSDKGEDWEPELIEFDDTQLSEKQAQLEIISDQIDVETELLGNVKRAQQEAEAKTRRKGFLNEKASQITRHKSAVESAQKLVKDQEAMLDTVRKNSGGVREDEILGCPCCDAALIFIDGKLTEFNGVIKDPDFQSIEKHEKALESVKRTLANAQRQLDETRSAIAELDSLRDQEDIEEDYSIDVLTSKIQGLKDMRSEFQSETNELKELAAKAESLKIAENKARAIHYKIIEHLKIAEAFSPTGIPSELLQEVLGPINNRLYKSSIHANWLNPKITHEFDIQGDSIPYHLLSESEKWRVDALLAECISHFSGWRFLMLDRFDVLDLESRAQLIDWLESLVESEEIETALLFGTLKQVPESDEVIQYHWVEGGTIKRKELAA